MDKSNFMPTGSPFLSLLNLAIPVSSMPLMMRLLSFMIRLVSLESCLEERKKGMIEQINVTKTPKRKAVVLPIVCSPFTALPEAIDEFAVLYALPGQEDQGPRLGLCCNEGKCKECLYRVDPPLLL